MPTGIYIRTDFHKQRLSESHKGIMPKNLLMIQKNNIGRIRFDMIGKNNWLWTGNNVSYRKLHDWVQKWKGKANHCENNPNHFSTRYHWANISGKYKRDLSDWKQLCPKCNKNDGIKIAKRFSKGGGHYTSI